MCHACVFKQGAGDLTMVQRQQLVAMYQKLVSTMQQLRGHRESAGLLENMEQVGAI